MLSGGLITEQGPLMRQNADGCRPKGCWVKESQSKKDQAKNGTAEAAVTNIKIVCMIEFLHISHVEPP